MSDDDSSGAEELEQDSRTVSKYQCPEDFVSMTYGRSLRKLSDGDGQKELWLIKAPAHFKPECFDDLKIPLSGLETVQTTTTGQTFNVLSSRKTTPDLHVLASCGKKQMSLRASSFSGVLQISENFRDGEDHQGLLSIPTTAAPSVPAGLKQRFQPFGCSGPAPTTTASPPSSRRHRTDPGESRGRRKKKKRDKGDVDEPSLSLKQENSPMRCDDFPFSLEEEPTEQPRKKKKKKKDKLRVKEEATNEHIFKTEPLDYIDT